MKPIAFAASAAFLLASCASELEVRPAAFEPAVEPEITVGDRTFQVYAGPCEPVVDRDRFGNRRVRWSVGPGGCGDGLDVDMW